MKILRKLFVILTSICLVMISCSFTTLAGTDEKTQLRLLADSLIEKGAINSDSITTQNVLQNIESNDTFSTVDSIYSNIQSFVDIAKETVDISDYDLGKFILQYTGLWSSESLIGYPEHAVLDALNYRNVTSSTSYYKLSVDGTSEEVDLMSVQNALQSADDDWMSSDGYIGIRTSAMESGTAGESGEGLLFNVIVEQAWLQRPFWFLTDVLAVNTTATYDDSYVNWAEYGTRAFIDDDSMVSHYVSLNSENNVSQYGCRIFYPDSSISGMAFEIKQLEITNPNGGLTFGFSSESRLGMRIIVDPNRSANIKAGYCHKQISIGNIGVSLPDGGISFSLFGAKTDYLPPAITVINY